MVLEVLSYFCCCSLLWYGVEGLGGAAERVVEAPEGAGREFLMRWMEVVLMRRSQQVLGEIHSSFNECFVDEELCLYIGDLGVVPSFHVFDHGLVVALDVIDADAECVMEVEVSGVLAHDRRVVPVEGEVLTDQDAVPDGDAEREALVVTVPDAECEPL